MNEINDLMTIDELARKLQIPVSWVYSRVRQKGENSIPHFKIGKYVRFHEAAVKKWLDNQQKNKATLE